FSLNSSRAIYAARCAMAKLLGCPEPSRVAFTLNSTEALNTAIYGLVNPGDHVITTQLEHNSVLRPLYRLSHEDGVHVSFVKADSKGMVDYGDFKKLIRRETRAIICTHASNLTGNALNLRAVGNIARENGLLFIVDASQTAGCFSVDMREIGADVLCFTGHKGLMGPQGTGGLCVRKGVDIRPLKAGGTGIQSYDRTQPQEMPERLEAGTLNGHGIAGLGAAAEYLLRTGVDIVHAHEIALAKRFYKGIKDVGGVMVYGDFGNWERCAIVALNIRDCDSGAVSDALYQDYGIATRPGAHCAPLMHEALGTVSQGAVRFSFSWFNTTEEADEAVRAVRELAQ
ncbi:MAG: aminotransferase class V-fold PLP-dependent enzyme, partial [Clostridia bacterium]|nr:aminotransferase class V-fold PLP-dependent enzyme [Clostridia bacterium]